MQIAQEILVKTTGSVLSRGAQFLAAFIAARLVTPQEVGTIFYLIALFSIFRVIFQLGLPRTLIFWQIKKIGEGNEVFFSFVIGACIWAAILIALASPLLAYLDVTNRLKSLDPAQLQLMMCAAIIGMIWLFMGHWHQARHDTVRRTVFEDIFPALGILISVTAACVFGVYLFAIILLVTTLGLSAIGILTIDNSCLQFRKPNFAILGKGLIHSRSIYFVSLVGLIFSATDTVFLMYLSTQEEVARYAIAARFAILANLLTASLEAIILPYAATLNPNSLKSRFIYSGKYDEGLKATGMRTLFIVTVIIAFSPLITLIFGPDYRAALEPLGILLLGWSLAAILGPAGSTLSMAGLQRYGLLNAFVALIANLGANLVLVPRYGAVGAALSVTISIFVLHGLDFFMVAKKAVLLARLRSLNKLIPAYLCLAATAFFYIEYFVAQV